MHRTQRPRRQPVRLNLPTDELYAPEATPSADRHDAPPAAHADVRRRALARIGRRSRCPRADDATKPVRAPRSAPSETPAPRCLCGNACGARPVGLPMGAYCFTTALLVTVVWWPPRGTGAAAWTSSRGRPSRGVRKLVSTAGLGGALLRSTRTPCQAPSCAFVGEPAGLGAMAGFLRPTCNPFDSE